MRIDYAAWNYTFARPGSSTGNMPSPRENLPAFEPLRYKQFMVKTAERMEEFRQACELRHEVFVNEVHGKNGYGLDFDSFDERADLLIIVDLESERIIGTYRLLSNLYHDRFYTDSEFEIQSLTSCKGILLELSRACVDARYRNGVVLNLLWRGISAYANLIGADYLFGCSSIWSSCVAQTKAVYQGLKDAGNWSGEFPIRVRRDFAIEDFGDIDPICLDLPLNRYLPPLMRSYLKAGAMICGEPAWDSVFGCMDFFTVLDLKRLQSNYRSRYLTCSGR